MSITDGTNIRALDALKMWHTAFAKNLEFVVDSTGNSGTLDTDEIRNHDLCQLGQWIAAQPDNIRQMESYGALDISHRLFHLVAGDVADAYLDGHIDNARHLLNGLFTEAFKEVTSAIDVLSLDLESAGIYAPNAGPQGSRKETIWDASFELGIPEVDRRHRAIAVLIDETLVNENLMATSAQAAHFIAVLKRLLKGDIEAENGILKPLETTNEHCAAHIRSHENVLAYLEALTTDLSNGAPIPFGEIGRKLANWYIDHLVMFDLEMEQALATKTLSH